MKYNNRMLSRLPSCERLLVIGDIHGDYLLCVKILTMAKVISMHGNAPKWIANPPSTVVVQVGDQIDSCRPVTTTCDDPSTKPNDEPHDWKVLKFFTQLDKIARAKGGRVISLLGNHEILNCLGDLRYVSFNNLQEFRQNKSLNPTRIASGKEARIKAFAPGNKVAKHLAKHRQSAIIVGQNLFVHAGILPKTAQKYTIDKLNYMVRQWLLGKIPTTSMNVLLKSPNDSPFWPRQYGVAKSDKSTLSKDSVCESLLAPVLKHYNVKRMIVGHTPQSFQQLDGINSACNEKLWRVDTGSSNMFDQHTSHQYEQHRKAQYLEIINDKIITVHVENIVIANQLTQNAGKTECD